MGSRDAKIEKDLRRLALQLAAQLPEDKKEAAEVLRLTKLFLDEFLMPDKQSN